MRAYSRNIKKYRLNKSRKIKKSRKQKLSKRGGGRSKNKKRTKRNKRQRGGYQTAPCSNQSTNDNQSLFESSFNRVLNNSEPTRPACDYIGQNSEGTKAYACV